jgi:hypothetical protein
MLPKGLRRVSQESFDEVVQGNIDDFELEAEEAVLEAIKEFELQGVDLKEIDKTYAGPDGRGEHPASVAAKAYAAVAEATPTAPDAVRAAGAALRAQVTGEGAVAGWGPAVTGAGAIQAAVLAVTTCVAESSDGGDALVDALDTLAAVLGCDEARDTFAGLKLCMAFTNDVWPACAELGAVGVAAAAAVVAAAATRNEPCKGGFRGLELWVEDAVVVAAA